MKKILNLLFALIVILTCVACDNTNTPPKDDPSYTNDNPLRLWYDEETPKDHEGNGVANYWTDVNDYENDFGWTNWSLPIGNGYFGVNTFGRTETERLQITDKTLTNPWQMPFAPWDQIGGLNNFSETYIDFEHWNNYVTNYERYLDLDTAISGVKYDYNGVTYSREYFASYPDNALVIYLDSSEKGSLDFTLRPTVPFEQEFEKVPQDNFSKTGSVSSWAENGVGTVELSGNMGYYDIDFMAIYKVYTEDGEISASTVTEELSENADGGSHSEVGDGTIVVSGATRAYIVVTLGTDYQLNSDTFDAERWYEQQDRDRPTKYTGMDYTRQKVEAQEAHIQELISGKEVEDAYQILKDRHLKDYQKLFGSVDVNLDVNKADYEMTTDELLEYVNKGNQSNFFDQLLFQYGRFALIESSRPGTLPAHLQGAWNCFDNPQWSSGYWHNVNVQMNYWPAFSTNIAETFDAYVDFNKAYMKQAQDLANDVINTHNPSVSGKDGGNGWTIGVAGNAYFISSDRSAGNMGFTTQLFWDYYRYTKDPEVLENAYKVLVEAARFITKCVKKYDNGYYLVEHSDSPEQHVNGEWYYTVGTTYAQSLSYLNNYYALQCAKDLGINLEDATLLSSEEYSILKTVLEQIDLYDPINVGLNGHVKEFREEEYYGEFGEPAHRHISQLVGLCPGNLINGTTPAWLDAAAVTLECRDGFSEPSGWPYAHKMNLYARVKDGDSAYLEYRKMMKNALAPNLWTKYYNIYQAEANSGATAGVAEMLLQSHEGYIEPLAALPSAWENGKYSGLVAEGNFEVSCEWVNSTAKTIGVTANIGGDVKVKYPSITNAKVVDSKGNEVSYEVVGTDIISFETKKGETYTITGLVKVDVPNTPTNFTYTREGLGEYNFTWDNVNEATKYNVYKAVGNASKYTLIDTVTTNSFAYTPEVEESNVRTTFVVTAVNKDGVESKRALCYFNPIEAETGVRNVFKGKQFTPTAEANSAIYSSHYGYSGLTDGVMAEGDGRLSTLENKNGASSLMDATINLGANYKLSDIKLYYYIPWDKVDTADGYQDVSFAGNDLKVEVYSNGSWVTVVDYQNSEFINYVKTKGAGIGNSWLEFSLNDIVAEKVRISSTSALANYATSFYEIECFGELVDDETAITNLFNGKKFTPTAEANNAIWGEGNGYQMLTDGIFDESNGRFSTKFDQSLVDATIDLGESCSLSNIKFYYYLAWNKVDDAELVKDTSSAGANLKVEVYANGSWTTVVECASADYANHLVTLGAGMGNSWLEFDLDDVVAEKVRISSTSAQSGQTTSFHEIECFGKKAN